MPCCIEIKFQALQSNLRPRGQRVQTPVFIERNCTLVRTFLPRKRLIIKLQKVQL